MDYEFWLWFILTYVVLYCVVEARFPLFVASLVMCSFVTLITWTRLMWPNEVRLITSDETWAVGVILIITALSALHRLWRALFDRQQELQKRYGR